VKQLDDLDLPDAFAGIDENRLDQEWRRQPQITLQVGVKLADARKEMLEAKAELEEVKATVAKSIRDNPEKYRIVRITEGQIEEVLLTQPKYHEANQKLIDAKYLVDLLEAAMTATEHKKKALESLVYMQGQMLHGAPRARGEVADELRRQEARDQVRANQKKLKRPASD
jgi:hypothetical protein